ncbi:YndM family protein [Neobacillus sp. PS3-12]|uniref:YndM family protein n=1 Tax=Neobacillus sp. PS3-12 TaxID=3070677 RepID=UPI0027E182E2|nr:YndM family protein [Neobacillus sp. PS3-12]WML52849.1 YndM family protein [Neobacillus sp. PS3-12]
MKNTIILLLKFISNYLAFSIGLDLFFNADFIEIATFSLLLTIVSYLIGDRILLPRIGNRNTLVADFFLAYVSVWIFGPTVLNGYLQIAWGSIISAFIITGAEALIHMYMLKNLRIERNSSKERAKQNPKLAYGLEMAEEQEPIQKK